MLAFLAFFLVFGSWSFAAPYDGPADEVQHVIRAAGVVSGQLAPKPEQITDGLGNPGIGAMQKVPYGLWSHAWCWGFNRYKSAACQTPIAGGALDTVPTTAGRYQPLYYAMVGVPVRVWPGWTGLILSRLLSAALSAALLASAFVVLLRWSRLGLMMAALLSATTPMLAHLAGAVNPNGLEISAGILLFAAGIPLMFGKWDKPPGYLVWLTGLSAFLLAALRPLGPLWLAFALAALLFPQSRTRLRALWRNRVARNWTIATGVASVGTVAWILLMGTGATIPIVGLPHLGVGQAAFRYIYNWGGIYPQGMVGVTSWFDTYMPPPVYWVWICAVVGLMMIAMVVGRWPDRLRLMVILFGGVVPPGVMQVREVNVVGFVIGGRYMLPLLVGIPLYSAWVIEQHVFSREQARSMTRMFALALLPIHMVLLVYSMVRWQKGFSWTHLNPLVGEWHPPLGSPTPLIIMTAGLLLMGTLYWQGLQLAPGTATPHPGSTAGHSGGSGTGTPAAGVVPAGVVPAGVVPAGAVPAANGRPKADDPAHRGEHDGTPVLVPVGPRSDPAFPGGEAGGKAVPGPRGGSSFAVGGPASTGGHHTGTDDTA